MSDISKENHPQELPSTRRQKSHRKNGATMTRRSFAVGLVSLAALGGAGSWYLLKQRLSTPAPLGGSSSAITRTIIDHTHVLILTGHQASVNALAWSPDGTRIVSASDDTSVQIFAMTSGQRVIVYSGHTEEVAAVGWSPDGQFVASGSQDGTVQIWRAGSGAKTFTYTGHAGRVNGVSWSSDNRFIASGGDDKSVQVWSGSSGRLSFDLLGHTAGVLCVGWQPGDTSVASSSWDGTLRDWAITPHRDQFAPGDQVFIYHGHGKSEVDALAWSPDGALIASSGADQTVQISHSNDGTPSPPFFTGHKSQSNVNLVLSVAWSPDGQSIASGDSSGLVYVWNVADRKPFFTYSGHQGAVNALAWSPDGKTIASAGADTTVQIWHPST